ncbi:hypothetical protein [Oricola indica]|jgi:hypothetical protein|uniref:hypothetical protein n=1 Tax=Oricola indica TaxID=2872591 RepID=UPI001CBF94E5|nr:hypothetical protein [Oricola indica]
MITRWFDLHAGALRVDAENPLQMNSFSRIFSDETIAAADSAAFALTIREGEPESAPDGATLIYAGPVFDEGDCRFTSHDGTQYLQFPDRVTLILAADKRHASITVAPGCERSAGQSVAMLVLHAAANATGQFLLHSAGVTMPGSDDLVVIFGQSGAGKTTTTLALCDAGFGLCSDDVMVFRVDADGVTAWGLPRNLKVHRKTAEMLDWVAPRLSGDWSDEDERRLLQADIADRIRIEPTGRRPVAGLFKLERSGRTESDVLALAATETLAALAADNMRIGKTGLVEGEIRQFSLLAAITRTLPTFRLCAGSDLSTIAPAVETAIAEDRQRRDVKAN